MTRAGDITIEILKDIRDEIRQTNVRLEGVSNALELTRTELGERMDQLQRRQTETEVRLATELVAVVGAVHTVRDAVLEDRRVRQTVDDHEARIRVLERRVG